MSLHHMSPPLNTTKIIKEDGYASDQWARWFYKVFKKLYKRTYAIYLRMTTALSPSIDPMADGLIGIASVALADDAKDESRNIAFHVPMDWVPGTDITLHIHLIPVSAQTGVTAVVTDLTYLSVGDNEDASASGTILTNVYSLTSGIAAGTLVEGPIFTIPATALSLDDKVFLKIQRSAGTNASDTAVGDIGYDGIHFEYTGYINHE